MLTIVASKNILTLQGQKVTLELELKRYMLIKGFVEKHPDGSEPSQWKMFCLTHKRKDGSMISLAAQQVVDEFDTLSRSQESSSIIDEDEIYHQVVGKERHGRVRGYGLGPTPTTVFGGNPSRLDLLDKLREANRLNEKMEAKIGGLEQKIDENRRKMEEDSKRMEEERKKMEEERKKMEEDRKKMDMLLAFVEDVRNGRMQVRPQN
ncbi:hypothetical protein REPUB_Repub03eG0007300 [Reevesia pubescens]